MISSDSDSDSGQYPDAGRRGDTDNYAVASENDAGTEEAYARYDLSDDAKVQRRLIVDAGESRERIGAYTDKDAGPDADGLA